VDRVGDSHVGAVPLVVYFIVQSVVAQLTHMVNQIVSVATHRGATGGIVSTINEFTGNILLTFHIASVTFIVQLLCVPSANALNVTVLLQTIAFVVFEIQSHPYVIVHPCVLLNVKVGVLILVGLDTGVT
jgi:hypothetical protein